jgi:signal transduction histidine kinase
MKRLSLTSRLIAGVALILIVALAVLERRASGILLGDKVQSLKDHSSQISYSLAVSASEKIKRLDRQLRLILTHAALNTPMDMRPKGEDMALVGTLSRSGGQPWSANWIIKDDGLLQKFAPDFAESLQKAVTLEKVRMDEHTFTRLVTMDKQPAFVMLIRLTKATDPVEKIAAGVMNASAFFDLVAPFKGSSTTAFLVDLDGVSYAHPNFSLTGAWLEENPIVHKITLRQSASEQGEYGKGGDTLIASFDAVPRTNLVAVASVPLARAEAPLRELRWSFAILGLGLLLLAGILALYVSQLLRSPLSKLRRAVDDLASGRRTQVAPETSEAEISELASSLARLDQKLRLKDLEIQAETHDKIYKEKMSAFSRLSTGLVNELRNPLIGVLGHAQLAREKIRDTEAVRRHLDLIERDVRKTKELVEDISQFAGVEKLEVEPVNAFEAVTAAIEQAGRKVLPQNITILKNLESVASVTANAVLLRKALLNVIQSCGQLISPDGSREIIVRLENAGDEAKITAIFESHVISPEDVGKIFDPFLQTSGGVELGLDLALARGIFEAHDARIELERTGETHFQFVIGFPKVKEIPNLHSPSQNPSPFTENPGLELKGLNFALPDLAVAEAKAADAVPQAPVVVETLAPETSTPETPAAEASAVVAGRRLMSKVPLEKLRIKIRKPTIRA